MGFAERRSFANNSAGWVSECLARALPAGTKPKRGQRADIQDVFDLQFSREKGPLIGGEVHELHGVSIKFSTC
jgi:hypothetical protein